MRKGILFALIILVLGLTACSNDVTSTENSSGIAQSERDQEEVIEGNGDMGNTENAATDGVQIQTDNPLLPTRIIENGTRINMHFGDTIIPGILNDSETAQALIERLPITVLESRYSHDFCGVIDPLPYAEADVQNGWLNGDITYGSEANWFTVLFADEDNSEQYGDLVNIGVIDCELSKISELNGSYDVLIELAE